MGRAFAKDARPFFWQNDEGQNNEGQNKGGQNDVGQNDEEIVDVVSGKRSCEIDYKCPRKNNFDNCKAFMSS